MNTMNTMNTMKTPSVKRSRVIFLQGVILLIGIGAFLLMLWEPQLEGRNAHSTFSQIYFNDPFLIYAYIASIPFFVALFQAFKLLVFIGDNKVFSQAAVNTLRMIKYCWTILAIFIIAAEAYISIVVRGTDDIAGGVMMGLVMIFLSVTTATAAAVFEKLLQNAVDIQSENDLTV